MRIVRRNDDLVEELHPKAFDGPEGRCVFEVGGDHHGPIKHADKWRDRFTGLEGKMMATEGGKDFEPDVPDRVANMVALADAEIEVANVRVLPRQNPEVIIGNETARRVRLNYAFEAETDLLVGQVVGRQR